MRSSREVHAAGQEAWPSTYQLPSSPWIMYLRGGKSLDGGVQERFLLSIFPYRSSAKISSDGQCICYPKNGGGNPSNQIPVPSNLASFSAVQAGQMQKPLKPALANSMQNLGQGRVHKAARSMTNIDAQRIGKTLESEANHKKFSRQGSMVNESNSTTNGTLISTFPAQLDVVSPQQNQLSNGYGHMSLNGYPHANGQLYNANTAVLSNHVDPAHSGLPIPLQSFASPYSNGTGPSTQFSPENTYTQSPSVYSGSISPVNYVGPAPAGSNPVADKNEWPALPNRNNEIYIASPYGKGSERPRLQPSSQEQINAGYMAADSQHCYCGAGCSCLLCPDHPHNTTTLMHLKEVTQILNHDLNNHSQSSSTHNSPTDEGAFAQANGNGFSPNPNHNRPSPIGQVVPKTEANIASPVDEVTEDYTGDDYLIVPYPMEQLAFYSDPCGCTDITGTCRCIEGCNCIGCM